MMFLQVLFPRSAISVLTGIPVRNANSPVPSQTYQIRNSGDGAQSHVFNKPKVILKLAKVRAPVI